MLNVSFSSLLAFFPFQTFDNSSVPKVNFMESSVLDAEEFLLLVVVPYLNRENMVTRNQPITAKLALKMFNCLGHQKCCEKISQPFVILLCLCEMLQECGHFWDCECRKDCLKQDIITAMGYLPLDDPLTAKGTTTTLTIYCFTIMLTY